MSIRMKRRTHSRAFKLEVVQAAASSPTLKEVARRYGVHPNLVSNWCRAFEEDPANAFTSTKRASNNEGRIAELERMVGQLTMENALLKKVSAALEDAIRRERYEDSSST